MEKVNQGNTSNQTSGADHTWNSHARTIFYPQRTKFEEGIVIIRKKVVRPTGGRASGVGRRASGVGRRAGGVTQSCDGSRAKAIASTVMKFGTDIA